jgi:hypothetical protein
MTGTFDRIEHPLGIDRTVETVQRTLGEAVFAEAWAHGLAAPLDDTISEALEGLPW